MKNSIIFIIIFLLFSSCSITKCRYSKGFKLDLNIARNEKPLEQKAKIAEKKTSQSFVKDTAFVRPVVLSEIDFIQKKSITNCENTNIETIKKIEAKEVLKGNQNVKLKPEKLKRQEKNNFEFTIKMNVKRYNQFWSDFFFILSLLFAIVFLIGLIKSILLISIGSSIALKISLLTLLSGLLSALCFIYGFRLGFIWGYDL